MLALRSPPFLSSLGNYSKSDGRGVFVFGLRNEGGQVGRPTGHFKHGKVEEGSDTRHGSTTDPNDRDEGRSEGEKTTHKATRRLLWVGSSGGRSEGRTVLTMVLLKLQQCLPSTCTSSQVVSKSE